MRSGTLDTPAIVGFATALVEATASIEAESARLVALRDDLIERAMAIAPGHPAVRGVAAAATA